MGGLRQSPKPPFKRATVYRRCLSIATLIPFGTSIRIDWQGLRELPRLMRRSTNPPTTLAYGAIFYISRTIEDLLKGRAVT